jgi:hypothetical protein
MLYFAGKRVDNAAVEDRLGTAVVENGPAAHGVFPLRRAAQRHGGRLMKIGWAFAMTPSNNRSALRGIAAHAAAAPFLCLLMFPLLSFPLSAAETGAYCAFEIKVREPSGKAFPGVPVGLVRSGTQIAQSQTDATGVARICDAPLGAVDIVVGFDICGSVLVRHVVPLWLRSRQVSVTYTRAACEFVSFPTVCHLLLRIVDDEGRPVPEAHFGSKSDGRGSELGVSDDLGRVFVSLDAREALEGVVTKSGYGPSRVSTRCVLNDGADIEQKVVLAKQ